MLKMFHRHKEEPLTQGTGLAEMHNTMAIFVFSWQPSMSDVYHFFGSCENLEFRWIQIYCTTNEESMQNKQTDKKDEEQQQQQNHWTVSFRRMGWKENYSRNK